MTDTITSADPDAEQSMYLRTLNDLRNARTALSNFEDKVREAAIRVQRNHSDHIGLVELNEWLTDLGLEPVLTQFRCTGNWRGIDLPEAEVMAVSEDEAERKYIDVLTDCLTTRLVISGNLVDAEGVVFTDSPQFEENEGEDSLEEDDLNVYIRSI